MNINDIRQLARWLAASDIASLELRRPDATLRLHMDRALPNTAAAESPNPPNPPEMARNGADDSAAAAREQGSSNGTAQEHIGTGRNLGRTTNAQEKHRATWLNAGAAGVFFDRHPSQAQAFVSIGGHVTQGDMVGLLQIGPLLLPVLASSSGTVVQCVARAGTTVGYGDVLFGVIQSN